MGRFFAHPRSMHFLPMKTTQYARKIDSLGRIVIPSKLRQELNLNADEVFPFFIHEEPDGKVYLCIECPNAESEIAKAKALLEKIGMTVSPGR